MHTLTRRASRDIDTQTDAPAPSRWQTWRRTRPLTGGILVALGGAEMFFSSQLDLGNIHVQLGIEGLQATIIPIVLVLLGGLLIAMPDHGIFYGVIALAVAVYSIVGVNLGGFLLGMLLSTIGGIIAVSWAPKSETDATTEAEAEATTEPAPAASAEEATEPAVEAEEAAQ